VCAICTAILSRFRTLLRKCDFDVPQDDAGGQRLIRPSLIGCLHAVNHPLALPVPALKNIVRRRRLRREQGAGAQQKR
jgi:hypothetical protein